MAAVVPNITKPITVALVGNPNTGKSTLFTALAGVHQRVGNYPGVTVEKKTAKVAIAGRPFVLVDLPGTYSLAPRSPDEMIAVDVLLGRRADVGEPDVILCIVDAANLERNLYLVSQVLEAGRPVVLALNMTDVARDRGFDIDTARLSANVGVPVVALQANRRIGINELKQRLVEAAEGEPPTVASPFPDEFQAEVRALSHALANGNGRPLSQYLVERLLLDTSGYLEHAGLVSGDRSLAERLQEARGRLSAAGHPVPAVEAVSRYGWVGRVLDGAVTRPRATARTASDRLDGVLTHKLWGTLVFVLLMIVVFQSIFTWSVPAMDAIAWCVDQIGAGLSQLIPAGAIQSLVTDGVVAGVGGVLVFLPQIFVLFLFIAILEDCGYMARAAFLMDRLMSRIGLSGKSFIPLLSSFACAIPGIMAARVIENRRDRLITILVAPLMSCSARLPVYTLLIAAFIPNTYYLGGWLGLQGMTMFAMYLVGIVAATVVALVLRTTVLRGETPPFVMELPGYKFPSPRIVVTRMLERGWAFIRRAGTLILAVSILVWAAAYFPHGPEVERELRAARAGGLAELAERLDALQSDPDASAADVAEARQQLADARTSVDHAVAGAYVKQSWLGRAGRLIEPAVSPLGWDWRIGCAVIASFPAREVVIGSMGVIYNLGDEQDEHSVSLQQKLRSVPSDTTGRPIFNVPVALSIMVFFALCAQCAATLVVMRRETGSWRWPVFTFAYMTTMAYAGAWLVYVASKAVVGV